MSLVAYDSSSGEESDNEDPKAVIEAHTPMGKAPQSDDISNAHISDEDDDFISLNKEKGKESITNLSQLLPKPKKDNNLVEIFKYIAKPTFSALPTPKVVGTQVDIKEDDDEFLHKKPSEELLETPHIERDVKKKPVKISIPSLKTFKDVENEMTGKVKNKNAINTSKSSGLLSILPKAKSEQTFSKDASNSNEGNINVNATAITSFVPDTVKHRRPATNTEDMDRIKPTKKRSLNQANKTPIADCKKNDSNESDDDNSDMGDFFSFNSDKTLPTVSSTEINALVAKKAAKIAEISSSYLKNDSEQFINTEKIHNEVQDLESSRKRYYQEQHLNSEAMQALVGGSTKRRRQEQANIQVIDINSSQVLPSTDEWMRTALASSTGYQPTGVLVDEEPASGTRRKHQITYLAHKAKANEAELQAMWSANRQNRRATQSKYGF